MEMFTDYQVPVVIALAHTQRCFIFLVSRDVDSVSRIQKHDLLLHCITAQITWYQNGYFTFDFKRNRCNSGVISQHLCPMNMY